jgi:thymidylate synthase
MSKYTHEDGTPFTKEEFLEKLETDTEFNDEFGNKGIDQISELIKQLKENPDSRRLMVNAWAVHDLPYQVLPPCHYGFQMYTRELSVIERSDYYYKNGNSEGIVEGSLDRPTFKPNDEAHKWYDDRDVPTRAISLMWNQRSCDLFLGIPFNIASYGLLLEIIAKEVNMVPEELIGNLGDVHLYNNHIEQAKEQITRTPYELPKLNIKLHFNNKPSFVPEHWLVDDFVIENYQSHPTIKAPLSN